jgi:hypothetical protein
VLSILAQVSMLRRAADLFSQPHVRGIKKVCFIVFLLW